MLRTPCKELLEARGTADADHDRTAPQNVSHPQYRKIMKTEKNPDFKKSIIVNLVLFL